MPSDPAALVWLGSVAVVAFASGFCLACLLLGWLVQYQCEQTKKYREDAERYARQYAAARAMIASLGDAECIHRTLAAYEANNHQQESPHE